MLPPRSPWPWVVKVCHLTLFAFVNSRLLPHYQCNTSCRRPFESPRAKIVVMATSTTELIIDGE